MIEAIVFDMDGVILDSETICDIAWSKVCKELNLPDYERALKACLGMNKTDSMEILKQIFGQEFDSKSFLLKTSQAFHQIEETSGVPLMKGAAKALEVLSKKYPLALASSTRKETVMRQLKAVKVDHYFKTFTCGDMVVHSKPDPEIYLMACKSIGVKPENCVAIEDSPNGVKSAFAAGLKTIMVPDKIQPTQEILSMVWKCCQNLDQVVQLLD